MGAFVVWGRREKLRELGVTLQGIGEKVRIVQIGGGEGVTPNNALLETLKTVPELATIINAKTEALAGDNLEEVLSRIGTFISAGKSPGAKPEAKKGTSQRPQPPRRT